MSTSELDDAPVDLSNVTDIYWRLREVQAQFPRATLIRPTYGLILFAHKPQPS